MWEEAKQKFDLDPKIELKVLFRLNILDELLKVVD